MSGTHRGAPTVVLLHGLARTDRSTAGIRRAIENAGFATWAVTYPSRRMGIRALAAHVATRIRAELPDRDLFAVTHSMGGILVRHMAAELPWRGVVMIAPPNQGSRVAQRLRTLGLYRWFYGPAGQDVCDPADWPEPPDPFAVIAGSGGTTPGNPVSWLTRGTGLLRATEPNDGTLAVDETRLRGMAAFGVVRASHTWIMDHPTVQRWTVEFLSNGSFDDRGT